MGVICPCGVKVDAYKECKNVRFNGVCRKITGDLTYLADVCVTSLASSTLSLKFEDTETPNRFSFLFTANAITCVTCVREGQNCVVTVKGTGTIGMREYCFKAIFKDQVAQAANDIVQSFEINGFFDQNGAVPVTQGSIVALGCQTL